MRLLTKMICSKQRTEKGKIFHRKIQKLITKFLCREIFLDLLESNRDDPPFLGRCHFYCQCEIVDFLLKNNCYLWTTKHNHNFHHFILEKFSMERNKSEDPALSSYQWPFDLLSGDFSYLKLYALAYVSLLKILK